VAVGMGKRTRCNGDGDPPLELAGREAVVAVKCIIAGSRTIYSYNAVARAMEKFQAEHGPVTEVVSGAARGVDAIGEGWARENKLPVKRFPADWQVHGRAAGPIRNKQMAEYADAAVILWDGESRGAKSMYGLASARGLQVQLTIYGSSES
jgi:hypothetical protein